MHVARQSFNRGAIKMTIRELIDQLEDFDLDTQIFVQGADLHDPHITEYEFDSDVVSIVVLT